MREQLIKSLLAHAEGQIAKHKANVEIYLEHPVGIGEHGDIIATIEQEIIIICLLYTSDAADE